MECFFLKQPLFADEAGFSAAVIGAFLSSLSWGVVFTCFIMMKTFQLFYERTKFNFGDVCLNIAHAECMRNFPVLNLLRIGKENISSFFVLFGPKKQTVIK